MDDLTFTILELVATIAIILLMRYLIPSAKNLIGEQKLNELLTWTETAVRCAQQTMTASSGTEKKKYVVEFLKEICTDRKVQISDEQLNELIEAAVKTMHMEEPDGVHLTINNAETK